MHTDNLMLEQCFAKKKRIHLGEICGMRYLPNCECCATFLQGCAPQDYPTIARELNYGQQPFTAVHVRFLKKCGLRRSPASNIY